jgi:hypothetical protein
MPEGTAFTMGVDFGMGNASEAVADVREIEKAFAVRLETLVSGLKTSKSTKSAQPARQLVYSH